jgi:voltage-gated potassium channel
LGKVLAAMVAIAGIALIAMPTGILAASFSDALARDRAKAEADEGRAVEAAHHEC